MFKRGFIIILVLFVIYSCVPYDMTKDPNSIYYVNPYVDKLLKEKDEPPKPYPIPDSYELADSLHCIYVNYDPFTDDYTYKHRYFLTTRDEIPLEIYFEKKSYGFNINFYFTYEGENWIFFHSASIINESGGKSGFGFKDYNKIENAYYNSVTEKASFHQDAGDHGEKVISGHIFKDQVDETRKLLSKEEVIKMKLYGSGSRIYTFSNECRLALLETINYYYKMAGFNAIEDTTSNGKIITIIPINPREN